MCIVLHSQAKKKRYGGEEEDEEKEEEKPKDKNTMFGYT